MPAIRKNDRCGPGIENSARAPGVRCGGEDLSTASAAAEKPEAGFEVPANATCPRKDSARTNDTPTGDLTVGYIPFGPARDHCLESIVEAGELPLYTRPRCPAVL